jgi:exonuclease 3'-5' domain-containing protein 1
MISIVQIVAVDSNVIWLVDITTLGELAFEHVNDEGHSLRSVLEGGGVKKVSINTLALCVTFVH